MATAITLGFGGSVGLSQAALAYTPPTKPAYATSWYVGPNASSTADTDGCNQGKSDTGHSNANSEVVLDFGQQRSSTQTFTVPFQATLSTSYVIQYAEAFAGGYYRCTGDNETSVLRLDVGTDNSGTSYFTGSPSGAASAWHGVVNSVSNYVSNQGWGSQVSVLGAIDAETEYASASATKSWGNTYSTAGGLFVDYGDAGGCPTSITQTPAYNLACNGGWILQDVWNMSWGITAALPAPQIYNTTGANANQWENVAIYNHNSHSADHNPMLFEGPIDQHPLAQSGSGTDNTSTQAWNQMEQALQTGNANTSQVMPFTLEFNHH